MGDEGKGRQSMRIARSSTRTCGEMRGGNENGRISGKRRCGEKVEAGGGIGRRKCDRARQEKRKWKRGGKRE